MKSYHLFLCLLGTLAVSTSMPAQGVRYGVRQPLKEVVVYVNGSQVNFDRVRPILVGRRILVPLRGVFEKMGAEVSYDAKTKQVHAKRGNTIMTLRLNSQRAYVNGEPRRMDTASRISKGHVLVPIRFIAETLDASVAYSKPESMVQIVSSS